MLTFFKNFILTTCLPMFLMAEQIEVKCADNDIVCLAVNEEDSLQKIKINIASITGYAAEDQRISVNVSSNAVAKSKSYEGYRNYYEVMDESDIKELHFIVKTLALKSLLELAKFKSKLEKAGDKIDHVHPLNFLAAIFTDEERKAYIHAIKKREGMVWNRFINGLSTTFEEEAALDNMPQEFLQDFSNRLGINIQLIQPSVDGRKWTDFVKTLIVNIPRDGDADRYDM